MKFGLLLILFGLVFNIVIIQSNSVKLGLQSIFQGFTTKGDLMIKQSSLFLSIGIVYIVLYWWYTYNVSTSSYQLVENVFGILFGIDSISLYLIFLTAIIIPIALLSNWNSIKEKVGLYNMIILVLGILLLLNFLCIDMLSFYILFESTLIPLFLLIGIYGANNKEKAAYYVLMFTFMSSLFMLLSIVATTYVLGNTSYLIYSQFVISLDLQILLWVGVMIGTIVKTPLYPFHIWLPVVHSESPLGGSIILAGIILKLTIYLIMRWFLPFLAEASIIFYPTMFIICLLTIIITSLITLVQIDLKVIIAYSSVSHMAVCILGVFANNILGIEGSYMLALSHGFISPGLFIAVGGILYDRYHTRILMYYQGLLTYMPLFSLYLIILSFANIGTPLSGNFVGEFLSLTGAFQRSPIFIALATFSVLLSAAYQMKLTSRLTGGIKSPYIKLTADLSNRESVLMLLTTLPCLFIGIYPVFILNGLYLNVSNIIYNI